MNGTAVLEGDFGLLAQVYRVHFHTASELLQAALRSRNPAHRIPLPLPTDETLRRWQVAILDKNLDCIRQLHVAETRPEHFDRALADGKVSTNV